MRALPASFQVVYRVVNSSGPATRQSWEVFTQTSPFDGSDLDYGSDPRNGALPTAGTVSTFDHLYDLSGGRLTLVSDRQPGPISGTEAVAVERRDLESRRLAESVGRSTVAGAGCAMERFGEPPVGPIAAPTPAGHDDMCIDQHGLDVRDVWTLRGRVVFERTAVEVRMGAPDPGIRSAPPATGAQRSSAPPILSVSTTPASSYLAPPATPDGFAAGSPVSTVAYNPSDPSQVTDTSTIWSFSNGGAVVTVEAGTGQLPWAASGTPSQAVHLNGLGAATSALRSDGPEIRVQLDRSRWVRVRGTVPLEVLTRYASELTLAGR